MMSRVDRGVCPLFPQQSARVLSSLFLLLLLLLAPNLPAAGQIQLVEAVKRSDRPAVRTLLEQQVDVNAPEGDGATALHWAVYRDDADTVGMLIDSGANVNAATDLGITPLALAAANGNADVAGTLLEAGADPDAASEAGVTPLMQAARTGRIETVRALLEFGADVNANERTRGQTALMWAVSQQHADVVEVLLRYGADVHARTSTRNRIVMLDRGTREGVQTSKAIGDPLDVGGSRALLFAARVGDPDSARLLLAAGADVNSASADGHSALVVAAFGGHERVVRLLLEAGADPNAAGGGFTSLHAAALSGNLQVVNTLLDHGADPNLPMTKGSPVRRHGDLDWALSSKMAGGTPLFVAANYLEVEIMRALTAGGADPAAAILDGTTPMMVTAGIRVERQVRPVDVFKAPEADGGYLPFPRPENRVVEAVTLLLEAGADLNDANQAGDTALHGAATSGFSDLIQLLADRGADLNVENQAGRTPLSMTRGGGRGRGGPSPEMQEAAELLRKLGANN